MKHPKTQNLPDKYPQFLSRNNLVLLVICLLALISTFIVASSDLIFWVKLIIFLSIVILFLAATIFINFKRKRGLDSYQGFEYDEDLFTPDVDNRLYALEEANKFFGASLKTSDMFRLITSRVNEIVPFASCVLFLIDKESKNLRSSLSVGKNSREIENIEIPSDKGLAGISLTAKESRIDNDLSEDKMIIPKNFLAGLDSAIAVPLFRDDSVYGVLELFGDETVRFDRNSLVLLEAVGERVAPLLLSSFAFEQNISNAMTDALTNFPNERAFYMVLENQIAESQRYKGKRPLTILSIDIKNFAEFNEKYGHITGDRTLTFAANLIKQQLRQMDFLARSSSDEFLVVLPTATNEITEEIIDRLKIAFTEAAFEISEERTELLELNFGAATFLQDGETAEHLLKRARLKKFEEKSFESGKIVRFPKDSVN